MRYFANTTHTSPFHIRAVFLWVKQDGTYQTSHLSWGFGQAHRSDSCRTVPSSVFPLIGWGLEWAGSMLIGCRSSWVANAIKLITPQRLSSTEEAASSLDAGRCSSQTSCFILRIQNFFSKAELLAEAEDHPLKEEVFYKSSKSKLSELLCSFSLTPQTDWACVICCPSQLLL